MKNDNKDDDGKLKDDYFWGNLRLWHGGSWMWIFYGGLVLNLSNGCLWDIFLLESQNIARKFQQWTGAGKKED